MRFVLVLGLVACVAYSQSSKPDAGKAKPKQDQTSTSPNKTTPTTIAAPVTQVGPVTIANWPNKELQEWWQPWWDALVANWPLVIIGGLGTIVGLRTLGIIKKQTTATEIAANAAKESADTAAKAAEVAEKTLLLTERADILISGVGLSTGVQLRHDTRFFVDITNYGRTRANDIDFHLWFDESSVKPTEMPLVPSFILGPGAIHRFPSLPMQELMTLPMLQEVGNGERTMRFLVELSYSDVFGKRHSLSASGTMNPKTFLFAVDEMRST